MFWVNNTGVDYSHNMPQHKMVNCLPKPHNVPFAGAIFVLEVLLCTLNWSAVLPALTTSVIAVIVSWWGLGNEPIYQIPELTINYSLILWSVISGPIFGVAALGFIQIATKARNNAQHNWKMILSCLVNFLIIGLLAVYFPSLLGNGKSPAQIEFAHSIGIGLSLVLLALRCLITWSSLRAGAQGGLLTPSLANGALLGVVLGGLWNLILPPASLAAFAIIGATAFLATAQKMPLTAIILIFELTHIPLSFLVPIIIAITGSVSISYLYQTYKAS